MATLNAGRIKTDGAIPNPAEWRKQFDETLEAPLNIDAYREAALKVVAAL